MAQNFVQLLSILEKTPEVKKLAKDFKITNAQAMALCCLEYGKVNEEMATAENTLIFVKTALNQLA